MSFKKNIELLEGFDYPKREKYCRLFFYGLVKPLEPKDAYSTRTKKGILPTMGSRKSIVSAKKLFEEMVANGFLVKETGGVFRVQFIANKDLIYDFLRYFSVSSEEEKINKREVNKLLDSINEKQVDLLLKDSSNNFTICLFSLLKESEFFSKNFAFFMYLFNLSLYKNELLDGILEEKGFDPKLFSGKESSSCPFYDKCPYMINYKFNNPLRKKIESRVSKQDKNISSLLIASYSMGELFRIAKGFFSIPNVDIGLEMSFKIKEMLPSILHRYCEYLSIKLKDEIDVCYINKMDGHYLSDNLKVIT